MELHSPMPAPRDAAEQVLERFRKAAVSPRGLFAYPVGRAALRELGYPDAALAALPEAVQDCFCGVGNPFSAGLPHEGEAVLDVGCGTGVDALVAAAFVGPSGSAAGVECTPEMLLRAQENAGACGMSNAAFFAGGAEELPFADASFDLLVSNGVYNLVVDKPRALAEAFRVLRPGGRLQVADQVREDGAPMACSLATGRDWAA